MTGNDAVRTAKVVWPETRGAASFELLSNGSSLTG
jgi:hypothetical protein